MRSKSSKLLRESVYRGRYPNIKRTPTMDCSLKNNQSMRKFIRIREKSNKHYST